MVLIVVLQLECIFCRKLKIDPNKNLTGELNQNLVLVHHRSTRYTLAVCIDLLLNISNRKIIIVNRKILAILICLKLCL